MPVWAILQSAKIIKKKEKCYYAKIRRDTL